MKKVVNRVISTALATAMLMSGATWVDINNVTGVSMPLVSTVYAASQINITEATGWMESAWVEWTPSSTSGVSYYKVSYSKDGNNFTQLDDQLVRLYKDGHWRADIVGISAGSYTVKVEAYNSSNAVIENETAGVTVVSHDRTGFTFSPESTCYDSSDPLQCGGYKGDGTPKDGAEILYITSASDIDSVTDSTGTTGLSTILQGRNKRTATPLIVRFIGKIDYSGDQLNSSGYIQIKPSKGYTNYNTTIEGIGDDTALNFGFLLRNAGNVEVRNIAVHDFKDDGMSLDTDNCNIWLHNNEYFYGKQGGGDKAKGDGSADVKNDSQYVTLSYNHFWDAGKCSLCGMTSESGENWISYHHNWFDHSDSRHPRIRTMFVHVYNNYYDGNAKYGVGCSKDSDAFVEGNYFRNCKYPVLQGSVGHDVDPKNGGSNTFDDSPAIGAAKLWNNYMDGANLKFTAGVSGDTASNADGCVATSRDEKVVYKTSAGATYDNKDVTNSYIQSLASKIQEPADAKATAEKYAGRVGGGDFAAATGFAFTAADDSDYEINTALRTDLTNYSNDNVSSYYIISKIGGSVDGTFVPVTDTTKATTETTTETTTEITTETTTKDASNSTTESTTEVTTKTTTEVTTEITTEVTTETTTMANTVAIELGEAETGFDSDTATDTGSGINVAYTSATNTWTLTDASTTAAAILKIPFASQSAGKLVVNGTAVPSANSSKWAFAQVRGLRADGKSEGEIISIASDADKNLAVRVYDANGTATYVSFGEALQANSSYEFNIAIDLDAKKADVTINGKTNTVDLNVSSVDSFYSTTSKKGERNVSIVGLNVYGISDELVVDMVYGDADNNGVLTAADSATILQKTLNSSYVMPAEANANYMKYIDADNDGSLTAGDSACVLQKVLNDSYKMPVEA